MQHGGAKNTLAIVDRNYCRFVLFCTINVFCMHAVVLIIAVIFCCIWFLQEKCFLGCSVHSPPFCGSLKYVTRDVCRVTHLFYLMLVQQLSPYHCDYNRLRTVLMNVVYFLYYQIGSRDGAAAVLRSLLLR